MTGQEIIILWLWQIRISWHYIEAKANVHSEQMDVIIYLGSEDITDDPTDEDFEAVEQLCYAAKELEEICL